MRIVDGNYTTQYNFVDGNLNSGILNLVYLFYIYIYIYIYIYRTNTLNLKFQNLNSIHKIILGSSVLFPEHYIAFILNKSLAKFTLEFSSYKGKPHNRKISTKSKN